VCHNQHKQLVVFDAKLAADGLSPVGAELGRIAFHIHAVVDNADVFCGHAVVVPHMRGHHLGKGDVQAWLPSVLAGYELGKVPVARQQGSHPPLQRREPSRQQPQVLFERR